jgi:hypothetical protein
MAGTPEILKQAKSAPLFQHIGEAVKDDSVKTVPDWPSCLASLDGNKWVNIGTSMINRIFAVAEATHDPDWMGRRWDPMIDSRKAQITRVIGPALKPVMRKHKLPKSFEYSVVGDFLMAWLLTEYMDHTAMGWSERIMQWYLAGHVPCGYTGTVPAGKSTDPTRLPDPTQGRLLVY